MNDDDGGDNRDARVSSRSRRRWGRHGRGWPRNASLRWAMMNCIIILIPIWGGWVNAPIRVATALQ
jgi:hypothetical protein